jgi:hypothetical protein
MLAPSTPSLIAVIDLTPASDNDFDNVSGRPSLSGPELPPGFLRNA